MQKLNFLTLTIFLLILSPLLLLGILGSPSPRVNCAGTTCDEPEDDEKCEIVAVDDDSVPRPGGPLADCCPLWRCWEKKKGKDKFYTIHGVQVEKGLKGGGKEKVMYSNQRSIVTSVANGDHPSTANAGGGYTDVDINDGLRRIQDALKGVL